VHHHLERARGALANSFALLAVELGAGMEREEPLIGLSVDELQEHI
jgi:hypothetical protein